MAGLNLSEEQIREAFEKARDESNINGGRLVLITEEYYDIAVAFARDVFTRDETLSRAFKIQWTPVMEHFWRSVLKRHMSIMLLDDTNDDVIGFRTIRTESQDSNFDASVLDDPGLIKLVNFLHFCKAKANLFEKLGVTEVIHFFALGVEPKYRNRGFASKLFQAAIAMVRNLDFDSVCITGEGTAIASQRIYEKFGFQNFLEMKYDDYTVDGEKVIHDTGDNKSVKIYGIKIAKTANDA